MKPIIATFLSGLLFSIGLGVSGMTDANKVIGFLNAAGAWDPSLAFVMVGAIGAHLASFKWIMSHPSPLFAVHFSVPTRTDIDAPLVLGSVLFGVGWALGGFCPGPALVSLSSLAPEALLFVATMLCGMALFHALPRTAITPRQAGKQA